jgi:hypothetical protein
MHERRPCQSQSRREQQEWWTADAHG